MVAKVKAGWRKIGFRFDAYSVLLLCEMHGIDISELDKIDKDEYLPSWTWCAYRSYQARRNRRYHISYKRMRKILARLRMDAYRAINNAIVKASPDKEETTSSNKKKVQDGTTSLSQDTAPEYEKTIS